MNKKSGIELIAAERQEQIEKHGHTLERDSVVNPNGELAWAASLLTWTPDQEPPLELLAGTVLANWDRDILKRMNGKPYKERLIIAGALIAAEIDRLNNSSTSSDKQTMEQHSTNQQEDKP